MCLFKKLFNKKLTIEQLFEKYSYLKKNSISFEINDKYEENTKSYFGGKPLVDSSFEWPYFETDYYGDENVKKRPLAFLLQIDCSELEELDVDNVLPHKGILSFFYNIESSRWGYYTEDKGAFLVKYFENVDELKEIELPEDLVEFSYPKCNLKLNKYDSYPNFDDIPNNVNSKEYEVLSDEVYKQWDDNRLLGYQNNIQDTMEVECELLSRGYNTADAYDNIPKEVLNDAKLNAKDKWVLLLQLDSFQRENYFLMFGDMGKLYFWIKKEDLENKNFDNVWMILQC